MWRYTSPGHGTRLEATNSSSRVASIIVTVRSLQRCMLLWILVLVRGAAHPSRADVCATKHSTPDKQRTVAAAAAATCLHPVIMSTFQQEPRVTDTRLLREYHTGSFWGRVFDLFVRAFSSGCIYRYSPALLQQILDIFDTRTTTGHYCIAYIFCHG